MTELQKERIERTRDYLCGYRLCMEMLHLRQYERKRAKRYGEEEFQCEDILAGNEMLWRARMYEICALIEQMKNGRAKLLLYYHYIRGESIEHAANLLGISRRTGYRLHQRGLFAASYLLDRMK